MWWANLLQPQQKSRGKPTPNREPVPRKTPGLEVWNYLKKTIVYIQFFFFLWAKIKNWFILLVKIIPNNIHVFIPLMILFIVIWSFYYCCHSSTSLTLQPLAATSFIRSHTAITPSYHSSYCISVFTIPPFLHTVQSFVHTALPPNPPSSCTTITNKKHYTQQLNFCRKVSYLYTKKYSWRANFTF